MLPSLPPLSKGASEAVSLELVELDKREDCGRKRGGHY
jgi:hypothetical protein